MNHGRRLNRPLFSCLSYMIIRPWSERARRGERETIFTRESLQASPPGFPRVQRSQLLELCSTRSSMLGAGDSHPQEPFNKQRYCLAGSSTLGISRLPSGQSPRLFHRETVPSN
ncbi:hypothetical protein ElyMa_005055400 [Elysia marginata]|uniref:Uncharacterized protein n=1 Tax=Elysia marginata TaxID=1093978 RepID=A0AAV4JC80_9GAST|nr:hypothetical protein ElyMa_005055400 [Elysia marginata]